MPGVGIHPSPTPLMMLGNPDWKSLFLKFSEFYKEDLPAPLSLEAEVIMSMEARVAAGEEWSARHSCGHYESGGWSTAVPKHHHSTPYPGHHPCDLLWMWEGSLKSATPENMYLHSTAQENRITGLAMMHVHYTREIHPDTFIQNFVIQHLGRMDMVNLLDD